MGFILIGMYGALLLWFIWVCHTEARDRRMSAAARNIPSAEPGAAAISPPEVAASEDVQGQRG
ncbi:MAG: hypothetical protein IT430_02820 [Phycisphaerales bacterium]|nr:hypothetical protein [Phycisphaerales bacterium]